MSSYDLKPGAPVDDRYSEFLNGIKLWNLFSQNCEDSILAAIFDRIGTENKWCFECGAADGLFFSNTQRLIDQGWNAILVECDTADFGKLSDRFRSSPKVHTANIFLVAEERAGSEQACEVLTLDDARRINCFTLDQTLAMYGAPRDIDLLVLDLDSQEYYVLNAMVKFRPRVLIVEYDPDAAPMFIPELRGKGQAGHLAMRYVAEARGYEVIGKTSTNLICVRRDLASQLESKPVAQVVPAQPVCKTCNLVHDFDKSPLPEGLRPWCLPKATAPAQAHSRIVDTNDSWCLHCLTRESEWVEGIACRPLTPREKRSRIDAPPSSPKQPATRQQVFANGQWQDINAPEVFVHESEMEAANAGTLPVRVVQVETGPVRIALAMSTPRLGFLRPFENLLRVANRTGTSYFSGDGVFWHHALTRSINGALNWYDEKTGDDFDFILVADYDTFAAENDLKELAQLLAHNPDYDALVPMQMKRGIVGQILGSFEAANMTHAVIPIRSGHFGFTLFRREFFERLPKPWFWEKPDDDGDWGAEEKGRIDADMGFWRGAMDAGLKVGLATKIIIGHGEEVVSYPKISGGQISNVYQPLNDWLGTQKKPEGIGVIV